MRVAVLIGFSYNNTLHNSILPGIIIDLYMAYKMALKSRPDKIIIITDITEDQKTQLLFNAIINDIVDESVLSFIEDIKDKRYYHKYINKLELINVLSNYLNIADQVFMYYTGHVKQGQIRLPIYKPSNKKKDEDIQVSFRPLNIEQPKSSNINIPTHIDTSDKNISLYDLRSIILSRVADGSNIFIIMDCCNGSGLSLPFMLANKTYELSSCDKPIYPKAHIIHFTSTNLTEDATATINGSWFSQSLFKQLDNNVRFLPHILETIRQRYTSQTAMIYSNYPNVKILWSWLFGCDPLVVLDQRNHILIINRYKKESKHLYSDTSDIDIIN